MDFWIFSSRLIIKRAHDAARERTNYQWHIPFVPLTSNRNYDTGWRKFRTNLTGRSNCLTLKISTVRVSLFSSRARHRTRRIVRPKYLVLCLRFFFPSLAAAIFRDDETARCLVPSRHSGLFNIIRGYERLEGWGWGGGRRKG